MASVTFRGKAAVEGVTGSFDVIVYPIQQTVKVTHNFEEEIIKDVHGFDASWLARNSHYTADIAMKLLGDTHAHAVTPVPSGTTSAGTFLPAFATVTLSTFDMAVLNGTWTIMSGADIDLANTKVGDITFRLRRYDDTTQNSNSQATPS